MVQQVCCIRGRELEDQFSGATSALSSKGEKPGACCPVFMPAAGSGDGPSSAQPSLWVVPLGNMMSYCGLCTEWPHGADPIGTSAHLRALWISPTALLKRGGYFAALHPSKLQQPSEFHKAGLTSSPWREWWRHRESKVATGQKCQLGPSRIDHDGKND